MFRASYVKYVPRQDNNTNGSFRRVEVYVKHNGQTDYAFYTTCNWDGGDAPKTVEFGDGLINPTGVQFRILEASNNNASCAEMEFCVTNEDVKADLDVFADDILSALREGFTEADFEQIQTPFVRSLAYQMMHGTYSTDYRIASYPCHDSPQYYSDLWNAPGKFYDQIAGVTGINISKGKHGVLVRGIPDGVSVALKVVAWYIGKESTDLASGIDPKVSSFPLRNGFNTIDYTFDYPGLAYICYYSYGQAESMPPIRVHFINGEVNGYLSLDKTNADMHKLTAKAPNTCMDVVGEKVHSIWTSKGLYNYCKSTDGKIGYRQYINVLDRLVYWEQDLLGFYKYNKIPNLRTMAYVNYRYYMFQGGFGVSFHRNQEERVLNCHTLVYDDYDAIWGLSHEWGHQHQMQPYFNWAGMTEVTNNMNSYYNVVHMGYTDYGHGGMPSDGEELFNESPSFITQNDQTTYTTVTNNRESAYEHARDYDWNTKLQSLCLEMKNDQFTGTSEDKLHAFSYNNYYNLRPFVGLYQYAVSQLGLTDFGQDMYEALRQTDEENGSQIEK